MNEQLLEKIMDESILLELKISELYKVFNQAFPEDAYFWWQLSGEEEEHAALIRDTVKINIETFDVLAGMFSPTLKKLKDANEKITGLIKEFSEQPPARESALNLALEIEHTSGEIHFQKFMTKKTDDLIIQLYQKLNKSDSNHFLRIKEYMTEHNIPIEKKNKM
ncbi:rubrerythrin family protein [Candidatus Latescibacterota bacterium]